MRLACCVSRCRIPFSRLQRSVRIAAQLSVWSLSLSLCVYLSLALFPSPPPFIIFLRYRAIRLDSYNSVSLVPPHIRQYLRVTWKPINPIWIWQACKEEMECDVRDLPSVWLHRNLPCTYVETLLSYTKNSNKQSIGYQDVLFGNLMDLGD